MYREAYTHIDKDVVDSKAQIIAILFTEKCTHI